MKIGYDADIAIVDMKLEKILLNGLRPKYVIMANRVLSNSIGGIRIVRYYYHAASAVSNSSTYASQVSPE